MKSRRSFLKILAVAALAATTEIYTPRVLKAMPKKPVEYASSLGMYEPKYYAQVALTTLNACMLPDLFIANNSKLLSKPKKNIND